MLLLFKYIFKTSISFKFLQTHCETQSHIEFIENHQVYISKNENPYGVLEIDAVLVVVSVKI